MGKGHISLRECTHRDGGRGSTQCYEKQPHLTDEKNHTSGLGKEQWPPRIGHRGEEKQGIGGGTWSKVLCTFCPHPCHFPPLHTIPGPDLVCPFFPPSLCPAAEALQVGSTLSSAGGGVGSKGRGWSSKAWMKEQWELSGSQVLQRLVTLLLQVTVVVFLGRQWHTVQWVMRM